MITLNSMISFADYMHRCEVNCANIREILFWELWLELLIF